MDWQVAAFEIFVCCGYIGMASLIAGNHYALAVGQISKS